MVDCTKAQFLKNNNKIIQSKYHNINIKNLIKTMSLAVAYYCPSTTFHVRKTVLGRPCVGLRAIY